jgi:hypothetical protein
MSDFSICIMSPAIPAAAADDPRDSEHAATPLMSVSPTATIKTAAIRSAECKPEIGLLDPR